MLDNQEIFPTGNLFLPLTDAQPGTDAERNAADQAGVLGALEALRDLVGQLGQYEAQLAAAAAPAAPEAAFTLPGSEAAPTDDATASAPAPAAEGDLGAASQGAALAGPATADAGAASAEGGAPGDAGAGAMSGGFWAFLLTHVERTVSVIDQITNTVADSLERPGLSEPAEAFLEGILGMMDDLLVRLDNFLDIVDAWAPPRFDGWIGDIRDRIQEERDDIDAILNPPAPVEIITEEPGAPVDETPVDGGAEEDTTEWAAEDFTGEGMTVVVIDTGWNTEFLGEDERPVDEFDFYDTDGSGTGSAQVSHSNDHGSWVDQVVRDVADGVDIIHLKVFPDTSGGAPFSAIEQALNWVIDAVEAGTYDISAVNLSLGAGNTTSTTRTGLSDEMAELDDLGVFSVVAAGNSGQDGVQILAADENAIAVSASTSSNGIAGFSQHDDALTDIFAFGQSVRIEKENGGADVVSGTSFAAPYVSGIAARLQDAADELIDRRLTDEEFIEILQLSGQDLNGYSDENGPGGYHIADADAAVTYFIDNHSDYETLV